MEQAIFYPFMVLPTPTAVPQIHFHTVLTGTTLPVSESVKIPRTSNFAPLGTLPTTSNVPYEDKLNETAMYWLKLLLQKL